MSQREIIGAFVKIPIDETFHTYGRIIQNYVYAIYDFKTNSENHNIETIENSNILFKLMVRRKVVTTGVWKIIGIKELPEGLKKPVPFFIQEIGKPENCWIDLDHVRTKVDPSECIGIERFAVWEDIHVREILLDYYNGVPNKNYEYARVKKCFEQ